jgi:hypothetical protein
LKENTKSAVIMMAELEERLKERFGRWDNLKESGGCDPLWEDGVNMNLVRNHIINIKYEMKVLCENTGVVLPDIYNRPVPPEVSRKYMAQPERIREQARKSLDAYKKNEYFQRLMAIKDMPNMEKRRKIYTVLGYIKELEEMIAEDDLVGMRRHRDPELCINLAKELAESVVETDFAGQMNMFCSLKEEIR